MTRLVIWRHGQTEWNATGRFQGHADVDLDDVGRAQAAAAATPLAALRPERIVTSDLRRARATAAALAAVTGLSPTDDARLRERSFGPWQGLTGAEIADRFPAQWARWVEGEPLDLADIEPVEDFTKRVTAALVDAAASVDSEAGGGVVVVVTHGGSARRGIGGLLGWPTEALATLGVLVNCHWSELRRTPRGGWRLHGYNLGLGGSAPSGAF